MFVSSIATRVLVHAPAKLNLFLEVLARRADGFHDIETLMAAISLCDTVELTPDPTGKLTLDCRWAYGLAAQLRAANGTPAAPSSCSSGAAGALGDLPGGDRNIVIRALSRLRERSGVALGAVVRLIKRIPSAAGLGGASSDAAAALIAANLAWKLDWPADKLAEVAAELGSDVPFFLAGGWRVCRGRGETTEATRGTVMHIVVVRPPVGLSTPEVYRRCQPAAMPVPIERVTTAVVRGDLRRAAEGMHNRLEEPAESLTPWITRVRDELGRAGLNGAQMSGSGSSCFGIAASARHGRRIAARLRSRPIGAVWSAWTLAAGRRPGGAAAERNGRGDKLPAS